MKVLIFGTGSIGKRHCFNIKKIDPAIELVFFRERGEEDSFSREMNARIISNFLDITPDFSASFVCCPTIFRMPIYERLISLNIPMYVEKPIASSRDMLVWLENILQKKKYAAPNLVGFNLRFLPVISKVKNILTENRLGNVCRAHFVVGQYLPDWRQGVDYRNIYSAQKVMGGGVVLDLCHEADLAHHLFGDFSHSYLISSKLSSLEIDSDDSASIILSKDNGPIVSIDMDYVSRKKIRNFRIVGDKASLVCDLVNNTLVLESPHKDITIETEKKDFCINSSLLEAATCFFSSVLKNNNDHLNIESSIDMHRLLFNN